MRAGRGLVGVLVLASLGTSMVSSMGLLLVPVIAEDLRVSAAAAPTKILRPDIVFPFP